MLIRDRDLLSLRMIATDGSAHVVTDLLVHEDGLRAAYVVADIGAWLADRRVRVGIDRFDPPDVAGAAWRAAIGAQELEHEPGVGAAAGAGRRLSPLALVTGPAGGPEGAAGPGVRDAGRLRSVAAMAHGVAVEAEARAASCRRRG